MYFFLEQAAPHRSVLERRHLPLVAFFFGKVCRFVLSSFYITLVLFPIQGFYL